MANKKLKVGGGENLKLPVKKDKTATKPKWQARIGGKKAKGQGGEMGEPVLVETPAVVAYATPVPDSPTIPLEPTETPVVSTTPEMASVEATGTDVGVAGNDGEVPEVPTTPEAMPTDATIPDEPATPKKPRKLKVKADAPPKKLSMMAAALQVLRDRKVAMTCPELIDVMATEDLWTSPGGKTPANTLYAAISRDIKEKGDASAFRKAERGRFEAR
jgi:hypothetical protein